MAPSARIGTGLSAGDAMSMPSVADVVELTLGDQLAALGSLPRSGSQRLTERTRWPHSFVVPGALAAARIGDSARC